MMLLGISTSNFDSSSKVFTCIISNISVSFLQGDSGGPLAYNGKLYGVVSFGMGCARPEYPGVYANVPNLLEFVKNVIGG